jgi:hypothetical protein
MKRLFSPGANPEDEVVKLEKHDSLGLRFPAFDGSSLFIFLFIRLFF